MERIMRAQSMSSENAARGMQAQRTLELNPRHPLIIELNKRVQSDKKDEKIKDLAYLVYDTALLASGFSQDDIEGYSERMYRTIAGSLSVESLDLVPEIEIDDEEEEEKKKDDDHDEL